MRQQRSTGGKQGLASIKDANGRVMVDCTECIRGWNGDKSCSAGWHHDKPHRGGCFSGLPLPELQEQIDKMPRLTGWA